MRKWMSLMIVAAALGTSLAQEPSQAPATAHMLVAPAGIAWGEPPPVFERGASFAVISGDPGKAGLFVVRLKMPSGYKIAPHFHPTDEHVTVLSGTFGLGMGDKLDKAAAKPLTAGGYALLPAQMHHYAIAMTEATVQVHGMGPFQLTYVNPADIPKPRGAAK